MRNTFKQWGWCQPFWYKNASSTKLSIWSLSWGQRQWDVTPTLQVIWETKQLKVCIFKNIFARALGYLDATALMWWHLLWIKRSYTKRCNSMSGFSEHWNAAPAELRVLPVYFTPCSHPGWVGCIPVLSCCTGSLTHSPCCFQQLIPS